MTWIGSENHAKIRTLESRLKRYSIWSEMHSVTGKPQGQNPSDEEVTAMKDLTHQFWKKMQVDYRSNEEELDEKFISMSDPDDRWKWDQFVFQRYVPPLPTPGDYRGERRRYVPSE